jgi:hypothetical protein
MESRNLTRIGVVAVVVWALLLWGLLSGCASGPRRFNTAAPTLLADDDRRPFERPPETSYIPKYWDGADHILFRPLSHIFLLESSHAAVNVNALDEVPDSSWFVNRLSRQRMTAEEIARGPCSRPSPETDQPWTVVGAKADGDNPGFQITTRSGVRYLLKFDNKSQWERASAADVVGSRLYFAAGFQTPCNRVVYFRPADLQLPRKPIPGADGKPLTSQGIEAMLDGLPREHDGTLRSLASEFLPGKPIGPWGYEGVRGDDPNDAVRHEDRRELRGSRLLAAWISHHDARSMNTLAMWADDGGGRGHVEHYLIDWGDTLGGLVQVGSDTNASMDRLSRRIGYTYYIDFGAIATDFFTFGALERPWERAHYGPAGKIFGYFNDEEFVAEDWKVGYPNPAFSDMVEEDGAWMARIIARFDDDTISAVVREARLTSPIARSELARILRGRRDRILDRYLTRLSSLSDPRMEDRTLCVRDRAAEAGVPPAPGFSARIWFSETMVGDLPVERRGNGELCTRLPPLGPGQRVVDLSTGRPGQGPLRVHVQESSPARVVGLRRPESAEMPL